MKGTSTTLVEDCGLGSVRICECGSLNLSIGLVTLHLEPEAFLKTAALLSRATEQYLKRNEPVSTPLDISPALNSTSSRYRN
jgi:hypothetical protein